MAFGRTDQYLIILVVGGIRLGVFDDFSGGAVTAQEKKYRPGGMGDQVSLGGQQSIGNITVVRAFDRTRDAQLVRDLINGVGKARSVCGKQPLDADGNVFGKPFTYQGVLQGSTPADVRADGNDTDTYSIEVSTDGRVS